MGVSARARLLGLCFILPFVHSLLCIDQVLPKERESWPWMVPMLVDYPASAAFERILDRIGYSPASIFLVYALAGGLWWLAINTLLLLTGRVLWKHVRPFRRGSER